ncbi:hypothetical protein SBBP2_890004 [Burkholderiales bacterium]|nr:hypothetical protein SBBP2_890004 [Burkholderiales bacterium]
MDAALTASALIDPLTNWSINSFGMAGGTGPAASAFFLRGAIDLLVVILSLTHKIPDGLGHIEEKWTLGSFPPTKLRCALDLLATTRQLDTGRVRPS